MVNFMSSGSFHIDFHEELNGESLALLKKQLMKVVQNDEARALRHLLGY